MFSVLITLTASDFPLGTFKPFLYVYKYIKKKENIVETSNKTKGPKQNPLKNIYMTTLFD